MKSYTFNTKSLFVFVLISCVFFVSTVVLSLVDVQGPSSPADQPEHGAAEAGEEPRGFSPDRLPQAVAGAGLVEGEHVGSEDVELAAGGVARHVLSGCRTPTGTEEPGLGSSPAPAPQRMCGNKSETQQLGVSA